MNAIRKSPQIKIKPENAGFLQIMAEANGSSITFELNKILEEHFKPSRNRRTGRRKQK